MAFKHTPAPWEAGGNTLVYGPSNETICDCRGPDNLADANAALIACAPELVDMLSQINGAFYARTSRKEWLALMEKTKPLIRKARGQK